MTDSGRQYHLARHRAAPVIAAVFFILSPASADVFLGLNAGPMMIPGNNPTNAGLSLDVDLDVLYFDMGVAAQLTRTVNDRGNDIEIATNAAYFTVKTASTIYGKLRVGILEEEFRIDDESTRENGWSLSGGLGVSIGKIRAEFEYTTGQNDIDYLGFGIMFLISGANR